MSKKGKFVKFLRMTPFAIAVLASGKYVLDDFNSNNKAEETYKQLASSVISESETLVIPDEKEETISNNIVVSSNQVIESVEEEEKMKIYSDLLDDNYEFENIDFDSLEETNSDVEAWISFNTMEYPIVQGENNEEYLHTSFEGKHTTAGTIFIDSENNPLDSEELSRITHIYGHNMKNKSMFANLMNYKKDATYYDDHKFGIIYTPDGYAYKLEVIAGFVFNASDGCPFYDVELNTESDYKDFNDYILSNSTFNSNDELEYGDYIAVLYTCSYEYNNGRYALVCRMKKEYTNEYQIDNKKEKKLR